MADTVEQVHVWDGAAWVPVVRDDCELPISSADGTVVLDSPAADTFSIETGGRERFKVDPNGNVIVNPGEIRTDNPITTKDSADLDASLQFYGKNYLLRSRDGFGYAVTMGAQYDPAFNNCKYVDKTGTFAFRNYVANVDSVVNICNRSNLSAATIDFSRGEVTTTQDNSTRYASIVNPDWYKGLEYRLYGGATPGTWTVTPQHKFFGIKPNDEDGTQYEVLRMQWNQFVVSAGGAEQVRITDAAATFYGDVQASKIVGSAAPATDASIELGAELLTSNHTPTQPNSIATKQTVDDKIWVGTTAEYNALGANVNPTTLYCLTD